MYDYRKLNSHSLQDAFPPPRIEEALESLGQAKYFSTLNLTKEVLQFLGFAGFYRRYVKGYSSLAAPLYCLTSGHPRKKKTGAQKSLEPDRPFTWRAECEED